MPKTWLCPECGRELEEGRHCPECGKKARRHDLLAEEIARQKRQKELREKHGDRAGLFK